MTNKPKIFTFWEPKEKIPAYIQLCMRTWKKFLPEYEIIVVDYSNVDKFLGKNFYDDVLYTDFKLMLQSDAIKCALLKIHGGIWLDADTVITSSKINKYLNISSHELLFIDYHLAFIKSIKDSYLINNWLKQIKYRIEFYKNQKYFKNKLKFKIEKLFHLKLFKIMNDWNFLGNSIVDKYIKGNILVRVARKIKRTFKISIFYNYIEKKRKIFSIDELKIKALPEYDWKPEIPIKEKKDINFYRQFYFENDFSQEVIKNTKGIILLHNSWTPEEFKEMTEEEILNQNNTLSNILKTILK